MITQGNYKIRIEMINVEEKESFPLLGDLSKHPGICRNMINFRKEKAYVRIFKIPQSTTIFQSVLKRSISLKLHQQFPGYKSWLTIQTSIVTRIVRITRTLVFQNYR